MCISKTKTDHLSKCALYRKMMQYGITLSTEHRSETNINFKKIVFKITHFLNKNKRVYNIPVKIKIFRYQNNTGLKYFADIRFGMFVVHIK